MAHHYRKTILDELKTRMTGLTGQVGPPLDSPDDITDQAQVPAICVFFTLEAPENRRGGSGDACKFTRVLTASILAVALRPDDLEHLAAEIESRMAAPLEKGVTVEYDGTQFQLPKRGEFEFHALAVTYKISFSTDEGSADRLSS